MIDDYVINSVTKSAGLAIEEAASPTARTTVAAPYKIDGVVYNALAAANIPALTGITVAAGFTKAILVQVSIAGVVSYKASDAVANVTGQIWPSTATFPALDKNNAFVGLIIIRNGSASTFTGGTTDLDAASITTTYIDAFGLFGK